MDKFLETVEKIWAISFVQALVYLVIGLIAAGLASFLVKKFCELLKLDDKLDKWGINEGQSGTAIKFIGKLTYLIVFLLFFPSVLHALGLESVSDPITEFANTFISYLPNIIAALVLVFIGIYLGKILSQIISVLLSKTKIDNLTKKFASEDETEGVKISSIIGKLVNAVVVLIATVQALIVLNIEAISKPALTIINSVFGVIPEIILAVIVVAIGLFITNIVCNLLKNLLTGVNFDGLIRKMVPSLDEKYSATKFVTNITRILIMIFIVAESVDILGFAVLTNIMTAIIAYIPMIIKALIIALVSYFGANLLASFMNKNLPNAKTVVSIVRVLIYIVAGFMILSQLDFATTIVNYAFVISLCALAVAFAIAFGIGGRDFAKKTLDKVDFKKENTESANSSSDESNENTDGKDNL